MNGNPVHPHFELPAGVPVLCLLLLLFAAGCTAPSAPQVPVPDGNTRALAAQYPPPGDLVFVDGGLMHLWCTGAGGPVVILEAGSTDCSLSWAFVQSNVSPFTRVCSYDRAGYGWSDPVPGPVSAGAVNGRLHTLLQAADIPPPYVMAGHSLGGEYVRSYAHRYPNEVAGLVLVDPGSEWHMERTGTAFTETQRVAVTAAVAGIRAGREGAADGTYAADPRLVPVDPRLPDYEYHAYQALLATHPAFWEARAIEAESAFAIFDELKREKITVPEGIPVVVIASGTPMGFSADPA